MPPDMNNFGRRQVAKSCNEVTKYYFVTLTSNLGNYCRNDLTPETAIYWLTANLMARFYRSIIKAELWENIWAERKGNSLYLVVPSYRGQIGSLSKIF